MKKILTLILLMLLVVCFSGCQNKTVETKKGKANGDPWINSNLKENITEDLNPSPKDDLYLSVNREWLLNNDIPEGSVSYSAYTECATSTKEKALALLEDDDYDHQYKKLVQDFFNTFEDEEMRNELGYTPVLKYVEKLAEVKNLSDLNNLYMQEKFVYADFLNYSVEAGFDGTGIYGISVDTPALSLEDTTEYEELSEYGESIKQLNHDLSVYMLERLGFNEEEANAKYDNFLALETKMAAYMLSSSDYNSPDIYEYINNNMSLEEFAKLQSVYPVIDMFKSDGTDVQNVLVYEPEFFKNLDKFYNDENIEMIKDYLLVMLLLDNSSYLDMETLDYKQELYDKYQDIKPRTMKSLAYKLASKSLNIPFSQMYIDCYDMEEVKQLVEEMCFEVIEAYREILRENTWASKETIDYAIEKLDTMKMNVGWPDEFPDYSGLDLSNKTIIEMVETINRFETDRTLSKLGQKIGDNDWVDYISLLDCNAFYDSTNNSINMILGSFGDPFYNKEMSIEEIYASYGAFWIGHEVSHAFDDDGAQFGWDGSLYYWWNDEDYEEFTRRTKLMADYLDGMTIMEDYHPDGTSITSELAADMTGLQCALKMAEKIENFDYEKFFNYYMLCNRALLNYYSQIELIFFDSHPLDYLRGNIPVQQFEEFYKTYDVKEKDGMYLAPEKRLLVW